MEMERYVVWSIEHQGWWRADRLGYAETLHDAWRFTRAEVEVIRHVLGALDLASADAVIIPVTAFAGTLRTEG
jgi:hypothetical protein